MPLVHASFSRDGKRLVTCGGEAAKGGTVHVWDLSGGKSARHFDTPVLIRTALLTADGKYVVGVGGKRVARLWDPATGKELGSVSGVRMLAEETTQHDATRVLKLDGAAAQVFDVATGQSVAPPLLHGGEVYFAAFSPDGRAIVTAARDRVARVWDAATGQALTPPLRHGQMVARARFSADGRLLMTTAEDKTVRIWELAPREPFQPLAPPADTTATTLSPDGRWRAVVDQEGAVRVSDAVTGYHGAPLRLVAFSGDGRRLATVAEDHTARVWDVATGLAVSPLLAQSEPIARATLSADGRRLTVHGKSGAARLWDLTPDERPVEDLVLLTELLSGQALDRKTGGIEPAATLNLRTNWLALRARYPQDFRMSLP